ncbi:MAG: hypothetical protein GC161_04895 [Planctomycetaceae bacterium]|nr:hypothetical protein [Planctomycetaceae bacterium]
MRLPALLVLFLVSCGGGGGGAPTDAGSSFNRAAGFDQAPLALAVDEFDRLWVGGPMDAFTDRAIPKLARFGATGSQSEQGFPAGAGPNGTVHAILPVADGSGAAWIAGSFTEVNGVPSRGLALLGSNGALVPSFQPGSGLLGSGLALAATNDGTGDVWVGGNFSEFHGAATWHLARVRPDGALALATQGSGFGASGTVYALAATNDGSGDVIVGGQFLDYNTSPLGSIVRIRGDTAAIAANFLVSVGFGWSIAPGFQTVFAIARADDGSGDLFVGGNFDSFQGASTPYLVRLGPDGILNPTFGASGAPTGAVRAILPTGDGSGDVFVGGDFVNIAGQLVAYLARLQADGSLEPSFDLSANQVLGRVQAFAPVPGTPGAIRAAGTFTTGGTPAYPHFVRLEPDGTVHPTSVASNGLVGPVWDVLPHSDGGVVLSGLPSSYAGQAVPNLLRLEPNGALGAQYPQLVGLGIRLLEDPLSSERFYVTGAFTQVGSHQTKQVARMFVASGSPDTTFQFVNLPGIGPNGAVSDAIPTPDGALLVNGNYTQWDGFPARNLVKLDAAGDDYSNAGFVDGVVDDYAFTEDGSGRLWAVGTFSVWINQFTPAPRVGLLTPVSVNFFDPDGNFAPGTGFDGGVPRAVVVRPNTADAYIAGSFASYQGQSAPRIVRLRPNGSRDPSFEVGTGFDGEVLRMALARDGTEDLYVFGDFTSYDGTPVSNFIRLKSTGSLDPTFAGTTGFNGLVRNIVPLGGNSREVYVCGDFTSYNGVNTGSIVRINPDGSLD